MNTVGVVLVLSLSLCARAAGLHLTAGVPNVRHLPCDSTDAEEAAQVAVDHINTQHHHGYKYTLNQIDDIKVLNRLPFGETYILEVDLLETKCHVLDPTPAENCTVRSLPETKVEGDCDVALTKVDGVFTVSSFRCKTSPDSAEDVAKICVGCPHLIPLNDSVGQQAITKSLHKFNVELPEPEEFALLEVSRVAGQFSTLIPTYFVEYAIVETNCTSLAAEDHHDHCVPLAPSEARHGFCKASLRPGDHLDNVTVDCDIFPAQGPALPIMANDTEPAHPHTVHYHIRGSAGHHHHPAHHDFKTHGLGFLHDPATTALLSSESAEAVPPVKVKRQVMDQVVESPSNAPSAPSEAPAVVDAGVGVSLAPPVVALPFRLCPGQIRHF